VALTYRDVIDAINSRTEDARSDEEILDDIRDGLVQLGDVLYLQARFVVDPWKADVDTYPAPTDVQEFRRYAKLTPAGSTGYYRLRRVAPDEAATGWYYDGTNIGLRMARDFDGRFELWYLRVPSLPTVATVDDQPDGGDMVAQALIKWGLHVYYSRQGDEESAQLADRFLRGFNNAREAIFVARRRLLAAPPERLKV